MTTPSPTFKNIRTGGTDVPVAELYEQAITWETLRFRYFTSQGKLDAAMDAADRAAHYQAVLAAQPSKVHLFVAPQTDRRWE